MSGPLIFGHAEQMYTQDTQDKRVMHFFKCVEMIMKTMTSNLRGEIQLHMYINDGFSHN